jgi:thioredoxin 1
MLQTGLTHLETEEDVRALLNGDGNAMICCGRMGPMCVPVYRAMEALEPEYPHVVFRDLEFDVAAADVIKGLPECESFMGLPFTVYVREGAVVAATSSIQSTRRIKAILDREFPRPRDA